MKFFKLTSVLDIFCLMIRYSKVAFKQLFLLHFDKNCKIINQYYNIPRMYRLRRAFIGAYGALWCLCV